MLCPTLCLTGPQRAAVPQWDWRASHPTEPGSLALGARLAVLRASFRYGFEVTLLGLPFLVPCPETSLALSSWTRHTAGGEALTLGMMEDSFQIAGSFLLETDGAVPSLLCPFLHLSERFC